jgi:Tol biopolymer transport system component
VRDNSHRIKIYSLKTGDLKGVLFGETVYLSAGMPLGGVETEDGKFAVYDLNTVQKKSELSLPSPFSMAKFSPDGKRLIVVTEDQMAYIIDTNKMLDNQVTTTAASAK